jgi:hypothetical protein
MTYFMTNQPLAEKKFDCRIASSGPAAGKAQKLDASLIITGRGSVSKGGGINQQGM